MEEASAERPDLVVIARSARVLAVAGQASGYRVHACDQYGDLDTRQAATSFARIELGATQSVEEVLSRLEQVLPRGRGLLPLVYGAGFEASVPLLAAMQARFEVLGNGARLMEQVTTPALWFETLRRLELPYPETLLRFSAPLPDGAWLWKQAASSGGAHVVPAREMLAAAKPGYLQQRISGRSFALWFMADGHSARIMGALRHFRLQPDSGVPFRMSGAVTVSLPAELQPSLAQSVGRLTRNLGLVGINGIDFVVDRGGRWFLLELNPRPPGTLALYPDPTWLRWQVALSRGCMAVAEATLSEACSAAAQAVVYAPKPLTVPEGVAWADWMHDVPASGTEFETGQPLLTISAQATVPALACLTIRRRLHILSSLFNIWRSPASSSPAALCAATQQ